MYLTQIKIEVESLIFVRLKMEFKLLILLILTIAVPCGILVLKGPKRSLFEL